MLYFITVWILLLLLSGVIGLGVLSRCHAASFDRLGDRLIASLWLGLIVLAVVLLAVALGVPLTPWVGGATASILVGFALISASVRLELKAWWGQRSRQLIFCVLGLALTIAALTCRQVIFIDTGLYHYGVIQWLSRFGAVPGVALLIPNLGFTSSWFALAAPFNPEILAGRASAVMNGFLLILSVISFLVCLAQGIKGQARFSDWFLAGFLLIAEVIILISPQMGAIQVSTSPDLTIALLIGIIVWSILVSSPPATLTPAPPATARLVPLILSVGAVTIKLTALPLLLVASLFFLTARGLTIRRLVLGSTIVVLMLAPLLLSGIVTSGCPLYPSSLFCLNLPWSPGLIAVKQTAAATHSWTSWYSSPPPTGIHPSLWLLWQWLNAARLSQVMAGLLVLSAGCSIFLVRARSLRGVPERFWAIAIGISGMTFLMLTTPFFRFGLSYLILIPTFTVTLCGFNSVQKKSIQEPSFLARTIARLNFDRLLNGLPIVSLFATALIFAGRLGISSPSQLLIPPKMQPAQISQVQVNDVSLLATPGEPQYCWATPLPCTSMLDRVISQKVALREPARGIGGGFMRKQ